MAELTKQTDILLSTINSRYHHSSFGLRYLFANMNELQPRAKIVEFSLGKNPRDIVETLLCSEPKIIGLGVYIWNTEFIESVVSILKKVAPEVVVILGGPEISYETETQKLYALADFVIKGEAEVLFYDLCRQILAGKEQPVGKLIFGPLPNLKMIKLPYEYYTDEDIDHRVISVEASRGCPYKCEYCLSSLDQAVRNFETDRFLNEIQKLMDRGARAFKFVDRTFNLSPTISTKILKFFLERIQLNFFLHFEMVPDRLPAELRELITQFPKGFLQFEVGVQTWNSKVAFGVSRRQDYDKIKENFLFLRERTGVHSHADLIVGLPGESIESFAKGFDALIQCDPDEIQIGILKRLKGTPISRHDLQFKMVYSDQPPFQILRNSEIDYLTMQKFARFAQFWDLYANSGNFPKLLKFFKEQISEQVVDVSTNGASGVQGSLFALFWEFSLFMSTRHGQAHAISRQALVESAREYLKTRYSLDEARCHNLTLQTATVKTGLATPARQAKHST